MRYRIFLQIQIHSSMSTMSSNDVFLAKEVKRLPRNLQLKEKPVIDKIAMIKEYFLPADETFYCGRIGNDNHKTPAFQVLVNKYLADGWQKEIPFLKQAQRARWAREERARNLRRQKFGHVLCKPFEALTPADYKGGFSDELMNEPHLKSYVEGGTPFGYIGHSARRIKTDAFLEAEFLALENKCKVTVNIREMLGRWLTSTDGRHFGDSLEGFSLREQKAKIRAAVARMFNTAFIYSCPEHKGSWGSTQELRTKYKNLLLEEKSA